MLIPGLLGFALGSLLFAGLTLSESAQRYDVHPELKQLATAYKADWVISGATAEDRLVFADVIATARAEALKRPRQKEDHEFGLASGCFPVPGWPKPPPPPPPPPPPKTATQTTGAAGAAAKTIAQPSPSEPLYQRMAALMEGIATNEAKRSELRRSLNREVLILGPAQLKERKLVVTDVFIFGQAKD